MAAEESVSPAQFGFITHDEDLGHDGFPWPIEREEGWHSKMLDLSTPLHTRQGHIDPSLVEKYRASGKGPGKHEAPEVVHYQGQHLVLNGHHRIAAAKQNGQRRLKVNFKEIGSNGE